MRRLTLLPLLAPALVAQLAKPFQPTAELNKPAMIGAERFISGSKTIIEIGSLREITLQSAELALTFGNHVESVIAASNEKLLIMKGSVRNPEKTSSSQLGPSSLFGFRIWERYQGAGKFQFVAHFDAETLRHARSSLKPGESAKFIGVWRVPADFNDFRLGLVYGQASKVAWYDLNASIAPLNSIFAATDGKGAVTSAKAPANTTIEVDGLALRIAPVTDPATFASAPRDPVKPRRVVNVTAANRLLLPVRWGWQYFTVELLFTDGTAAKAYPEIVDQSTGKPWVGDLAAGASTTCAFHFYPDKPRQVRALRLTTIATGRTVELAF